MSLTKRKKRPLTRDTSSLRDDRLFIVACDDTYAPKQYFDFFKLSRVQVHVISAQDCKSAATHVLKRLLEFEHEEDDELWMLLDTDHYTHGTHFPNFISTIQEAKQKGIRVALSRPCFELWLLLHHVDKSSVVSLVNAEQTESKLRNALGQYNKTKLKRQHYPLASVCRACKSAKQLDSNVEGGDNPSSNTSRVYLLWQAIVSKALPSQLPRELKEILPFSH